jgi:signal transduction histidine kinase/CheY-like chemotaxis protein
MTPPETSAHNNGRPPSWDSQTVLEAIPFPALVVDRNHRILWANRAAVDLWGEVEGQICHDVVPGLDDLMAGCPLNEAQVEGPVEREIFDEARGAWLQVSVFPMAGEDNDDPVYLHIIRDVTRQRNDGNELRRSLEHHWALSEILQALQRASTPRETLEIVIDRILALSWVGLTTTAAGFLVEGEMLRMVARRNISPELDRSCSRVPRGRCLCGSVAQSGETLVSSAMGEDHTIRLPAMEDHGHVVLPLKHPDRVLGVLNFYLPAGAVLSEHQQTFLENAASVAAVVLHRLQLQSRMLQADRMASMGLLAAGVAHEINNPLTYATINLESIGQALQVGSPPPSPEELGLWLREATHGLQRVHRLVGELKSFSRVEEEQREPVDLNGIIQGAVNMSSSELKHRARVALELGEIPAVLGSRGRLSQVFLNLLINAAQAMEEPDAAGNQVRVRTWAEEERVLAEVQDTGQGIAPDLLGRLFEPFFSTKPVGVGTGLGLPICHGIVSSLGGQIEVESEVGRGSRFVVSLPRAIEAPEGAGASSSSLEREVSPSVHHRVLLIDDEPYVRSSIARMLGQEHEVVLAESGQAAKRVLEADEAFDLILCDLMMPGMSGIDLYEWLQRRRLGLATRMVFMTGGTCTARARAFFRRVSITTIEKPFGLRELMALVRGELGRQG